MNVHEFVAKLSLQMLHRNQRKSLKENLISLGLSTDLKRCEIYGHSTYAVELNSFYHSVQNPLSPRLLSERGGEENMKIYNTVTPRVTVYEHQTSCLVP
jgi:hypothetical protein